jgi:hypothetical protein
MENSEFPFRHCGGKRRRTHREMRFFAQANGLLDVHTSFALDGQTKNGESPETRASIGFQGFRRF